MFKKKKKQAEPEEYINPGPTERVEASIGGNDEETQAQQPDEQKIPEHIKTHLEELRKWAGVYHPDNFPDVAKAEGLTLLLHISSTVSHLLNEQVRTNELLEENMKAAP